MSGDKEAARELVREFAGRTAAPAFAHIDRATLAAGLEDRINDAARIDQDGANLCGPAAFVYEMATRDPVVYARFVIDLYENGKAEIGKFVIQPSDSLKRYKLPDQLANGGSAPHPADWIPMAGIRNAKGSFVFWDSYDNADDEASGITPPSHLQSWLVEIGYQKVIDKTSVAGMLPKTAAKNLSDALAKLDDGYKVFLLIRAAMLNGEKKQKKKSFGSFPNHWVVLDQGSMTDDSLRLRVYSWGEKRDIPPPGSTWSPSDVLARYHGFIAAQY